MHNFKKFEAKLTRPETEEVDVEIWQPKWECFCCHDSGIVVPHLAALVIEEYSWDNHYLPLCQNLKCQKGRYYSDSLALFENLDLRLHSGLCKELDEIERKNWRQTTFVKFQHIQDKIQGLSREKNLRQRDRTHLEQQYAESKHQECQQKAEIENNEH